MERQLPSTIESNKWSASLYFVMTIKTNAQQKILELVTLALRVVVQVSTHVQLPAEH